MTSDGFTLHVSLTFSNITHLVHFENKKIKITKNIRNYFKEIFKKMIYNVSNSAA